MNNNITHPSVNYEDAKIDESKFHPLYEKITEMVKGDITISDLKDVVTIVHRDFPNKVENKTNY